MVQSLCVILANALTAILVTPARCSFLYIGKRRPGFGHATVVSVKYGEYYYMAALKSAQCQINKSRRGQIFDGT